MNTDELINAMAADNLPRRSYLHSFVLGSGIGIAADALLFFIAVGPRADFAAAVETWRYLFKFVVTMSLAVPAMILTYQTAAPAMWGRYRLRTLAVSLCLLAAAAVLELDLLPPSVWMTRLVGSNSVNCVTLIPLLAVIPLICLLALLRHGAPCDGGLAGAAAGLAASSISATFYALNCFDDSPLFVIVWYPLAAVIVVMAGYLLGRRFLVW
jgi:hypothetical protein